MDDGKDVLVELVESSRPRFIAVEDGFNEFDRSMFTDRVTTPTTNNTHQHP